MTDQVKVAEALVVAGYLTESDIEAAADILADALIVEVAEEVEAAAIDDYSEQEDLIAEAEVWEAEDVAEGDIEGAVLDADIVAAYMDAASALVAAELIDEADLSPVAAIIADVWVVAEEVD
jgi:hypothetical protein